MAINSKTTVIIRKIQNAKSVTKMLRVTGKEPALPPFGEYLDRLRIEKGLKKEEFFTLGGVSTAYGYEIIRGMKSPSRDKLIRFAFVLGLDVGETQDLLKVGEKAKLYPMIKRDALIIYALSHGQSIAELNKSAEENGVTQIGNY